MTPTPEQIAAAKEFLHRWRLDDSHGHLEALAELIAERERKAELAVYRSLGREMAEAALLEVAREAEEANG